MRISTFFFLTRRGLRNLGKHWAMTIACIASLSVCMTLNSFASLAEVNVDSMVSYLGSQNETVVYLDPDCDDATACGCQEHRALLAALKLRDAREAARLMREHLERLESQLSFSPTPDAAPDLLQLFG